MDNNENNNLIKNDSLFNSYSKIKLFVYENYTTF